MKSTVTEGSVLTGTPHTWFFSCTLHVWLCAHSLRGTRLSCRVRSRVIHVCTWAVVFVPLQSLFPFDSSFLVSVHFIHTNFSDDVAGSEHHCAESTKRGLWLSGKIHTSHRLWAPRDRQFRRHRGHRFVLPGLECHVHLRLWRQRRGVPRRWDRRRARQECAGFTTVTSRSEKQMRACCKLITPMKKACCQVHGQSWQSQGEPVAWLSQKNLAKGLPKTERFDFEIGCCRVSLRSPWVVFFFEWSPWL